MSPVVLHRLARFANGGPFSRGPHWKGSVPCRDCTVSARLQCVVRLEYRWASSPFSRSRSPGLPTAAHFRPFSRQALRDRLSVSAFRGSGQISGGAQAAVSAKATRPSNHRGCWALNHRYVRHKFPSTGWSRYLPAGRDDGCSGKARSYPESGRWAGWLLPGLRVPPASNRRYLHSGNCSSRTPIPRANALFSACFPGLLPH